jgi:hypothetical protein
VSDLFGVNGPRLAGTPRLRAAFLIQSHRASRPRFRAAVLASAICAALLAALLYGEREPAALMLAWLRHHIFAAAVLAALGSAVVVARRRALARIEFRRSWLAVLLATHSLDIVEHYADRAALLIDGRIKRQWQHAEIRQMRESNQDFEAALALAMQ